MKFVRKNKKVILWTAFPVLFGVFFAAFLFSFLKNGIALEPKESVMLAEALTFKEEKPKYFYINKSEGAQPKVTAQAFLVGDLKTGEVILAKNQGKKFPMASVSKLMTALVTSELAKSEDIVSVSNRAVATLGQNGELRTGEKIKATDLVYPLLLESSNDAAEALAEYFGREEFLKKMNLQAEQIDLSSTSYEDPSGLSPNNKSTAADLFKLVGYIEEKHGELFDITTKRSYKTLKHNWSNISQFLGKDGYAGGKSGYTDAALQSGVAIFDLPLGESGTRPIAITLLRSRDRKKDVENILKYLESYVYYGGKTDAAEAWVEEKVGMPPIYEPSFVTLSFMGDLMLDRGVRSSTVKNFANDYSALFEKIPAKLLKNSDIAFANLEGTASDQGKDQGNLYSFRMDPGVVPALAGAGIDVLSLANNHIGDWGRNAYTDTLARLKENEILYTGGGINEVEAETPIIIEKYGMKIGFLGFSDVGPKWMEAGVDTAGLLLASDPRFDEIVKNAASQVDFLITSFHWGDEYKDKHNARQEHLAHRAVDNGAKLVIGHHPHVAEDTEVYKDSFIAYSLGNFIFDQSWSTPTMQGMLLQVKLWKDGSMDVKKNTTYLNSVFQLDRIVEGKEEKLKFPVIKTP
ncbi:MAG: CapA family protein [Candidatus Paceibacterota bacterium]|jgi:poly-gamma-glutamate synthesis protein (capsule biosynthesis protein)